MQLTVLLFLVSHQFFCHQISFCYNFSELHSTSSEKDFCHKFYFFNEFTQITHPLNSQNLLSVTKVPTTDSLVSFSEHISRTAILTQASVITCKQNFQIFFVLVLHVQPLLFHFSKINLKSDQCLLLMVSLLNSQGMKSCKSRESFCLRKLTSSTNDWSTF